MPTAITRRFTATSILALSLGLFASPPLLAGDAPSCFSLVLKRIHQEKKEDAQHLKPANALLIKVPAQDASKLSVRVIETIETTSPQGPRFVLERTDGLDWQSEFGRKNLAVQGDPRRFIFIAGRDVARFFGYEILSDRKAIVPSRERFMNAVRRLNDELPPEDRIPLTFSEAQGVLTTTDFLRNFAERGDLPIADALDGTDHSHGALVHDHAFHTASLYLPGDVVSLAQRQRKEILDFRRFVEERAPEIKRDFGVQDKYDSGFFGGLEQYFATATDIGSGDFTAALRDSVGQRELLKNAHRIGYDLFAFGGRSPKQLIESIEKGIFPGNGIDKERWYGGIDVWDTYLNSGTPMLYPAKHSARFRELVAEYVKHRESDPTFSQGLRYNRERFNQSVQRRRRRIEALIRLGRVK